MSICLAQFGPESRRISDTVAGWSFDDLSQPMVVFIMTGLTIIVPTISGMLIYHSLNMPHAQHGHDDH